MGLSKKTVVVVGGGFCGALCVVHLLRSGIAGIGRIVLVDDGARIGRGVAYSTDEPLHLLNVPAGRMSAFPHDAEHFLRFAQSIDATARGGDFLPRKMYGDYIESVLLEAAQTAGRSGIEFSQLSDCVVDIEPSTAGRWNVVLRSGVQIAGDRVILALGNGAPRAPSIAKRSLDEIDIPGFAARYVDNPWAADALRKVDFEQPVLLVGTGLTAVDVVTSLRANGFRKPLHALSRRGLLPLAHRGLHHARQEPKLPAELLQGSLPPAQFLRCLRNCIRAAESDAVDWRDVLAALRKDTPLVWKSFDSEQRASFLRHGQVYWDVHRHRIAPTVAAHFSDLIATRQLQVHAGRMVAVESAATASSTASLQVRYVRRGTGEERRLDVGTIINCTGPSGSIALSSAPLWQALLRRALVRPDALGIGIAVAPDYGVIGADGGAAEGIYYVGPLLKAQCWEATAVPELREHVANLVAGLGEKARS